MAGRDNPFKPPEDTTYTKETTKVNPGDLLKATVEEVVLPVTQGAITYNGDAARLANGSGTLTQGAGKGGYSKGNDIVGQLFSWDIAQSHYFTVQIYSPRNPDYPYPTGLHDKQGKPFSFCSGQGTWKDYIPLKSMNFNYTSYDNMSLPLHILGDFPLLHRKKVTTIQFSCYDMDDDRIELALKAWENQCFPGACVEYLDNIKAQLTYTSYDVKGKKNFSISFEVIPTGTVSVSRGYEENSAKFLTFSVVAVGAPGVNANMGAAGGKGNVGRAFTYGELGYGGPGEVDYVYELSVQGAIPQYSEKYKVQVT